MTAEERVTKSGYDLQPGDRFRYGGQIYVATAPARGEFNAYVQVNHEVSSEIIIRHGDRVEVLATGQ